MVHGTVTSLTGYGAFVDLGGVEGLLHVSEISHSRVADPAEVLAVGQPVEVEVLKIEPAKEPGGHARISLSLRALEPDPWRRAAERFPEGTVTAGKVVRLAPFGAFVEIAPGVDGLVHVSELAADRRVDHPRQVVEVGQEVTVRVLAVDGEKRRISLTMAAPAGEEEGEEAGGEPARGPERRRVPRHPRRRLPGGQEAAGPMNGTLLHLVGALAAISVVLPLPVLFHGAGNLYAAIERITGWGICR